MTYISPLEAEPLAAECLAVSLPRWPVVQGAPFKQPAASIHVGHARRQVQNASSVLVDGLHMRVAPEQHVHQVLPAERHRLHRARVPL